MSEKIQQIRALLDELEAELGGTTTGGDAVYPVVFDLQPEGFAKLGVVEEFRDKLKKSPSQSALDRRYEAGLPEYWFVQDMENYFFTGEYTSEMESAQAYACSQATSHPVSPADKWQHWFHAFRLEIDDEGHGNEVIIRKNNRIVGAVAADARNASGTKVLKVNPRVADMKRVLEANYKYYVERNKDAILPISTRLPIGTRLGGTNSQNKTNAPRDVRFA